MYSFKCSCDILQYNVQGVEGWRDEVIISYEGVYRYNADSQ